jgi:hypothetical protein
LSPDKKFQIDRREFEALIAAAYMVCGGKVVAIRVVAVLPTVEERRRLLLRMLLGAMVYSQMVLVGEVNFIRSDGRPLRQLTDCARILL